ncbi:MAG: ATPase [Lachnospiraceae bacterium]|nr:ATPase [Lachnospiraceae bacterium]
MYQIALKKKKLIEKELQNLKQQLDPLPEGNLICTSNGKYDKWYDGRCYIPKSEKNYAEKLALRKLLEAKIDDLSREKEALEAYLKKHQHGKSKEEIILSRNGVRRLLVDQWTQKDEYVDYWSKKAYPKNQRYPEHLKCKTITGDYVRSKSEAIIYNQLIRHKIPFRYECRLQLGNQYWYPDFTILHPMTKELIYWEHFGLMDKDAYRKNALHKLNVYAENGIIEHVNLITTCETENHPLDSARVENEIKFHFEN